MNPIVVFVSLQVVWVAVMVIWVIWFINRQEELANLARNFGVQYIDSGRALGVLVAGCILLGVILFGTVVLFVFGQRQSFAIQQQRSFLSSVTHELRSPLSSLQLAFETLKTRTLEVPVRDRMMTMILSDIRRLERLVDQILVSARLDRGIIMFQDEREDLDFANVVGEAVDAASYLDSELSQRVHVEAGIGIHMLASRPAFMLILGNLIENAIKYSPRGTSIVIRAERIKELLRISVKDQGFGLEKKDRRRIFKMFHRATMATKRAIPGTGLGLFIVKSAVSMLGGRVWAESPGLGQGATFFLEFPLGNKIHMITQRGIAKTGYEAQ